MSNTDKWSALSMKDKADLIKLMVENGVTSLDDMKLYYNGGEKPTVERRQYDGKDISLETYKQIQRDKIISNAVEKALERKAGVAPMIDGKPALSCIYTATDNFGNKYRVMGNQTFSSNPSKYGFEIAGPLDANLKNNIGKLYQEIDNTGNPYHMVLVTGDNGEQNLVSYSKGHANDIPLSEGEWKRSKEEEERLLKQFPFLNNATTIENNLGESYNDYLNTHNKRLSNDYQKNKKIGKSYSYETYKFIGTPEDNVIWEKEFNELPNVEVLPAINNYATEALKKESAHYNSGNLFGGGGKLKAAIKYGKEAIKAKGEDILNYERLNKIFDSLSNKQKRRAINVALRQSHNPEVFNALNEWYENTTNDEKIKDAIYILFGIGSPTINNNRGLYQFDKITGKAIQPTISKNDIIDAVTLGKEVSPEIGINVRDNDFGILQDYKDSLYPDKKVQLIETQPLETEINQNGIESKGIVPGTRTGSFRTLIPKLYIDTAGYSLEEGTRNDSTFVRAWDVYDFASREGDKSGYKERWDNNDLIDKIQDNITPLFIRTPWVYVNDFDKVVNQNFKYGGNFKKIIW